jgi:hypothetical protein
VAAPDGAQKLVDVCIWLGYAIWCGHLAAGMGCFVASLAVVDAWGGATTKWSGQGRPAGSHGGAPGGAALTFAPGRAAGAVFFLGGALGDKRLDRAGGVRPSWARKN